MFDALFDFRLNVQIQKRKKEEDQLSIKIQEEKEQQQEREKELLFNKQIEKINNGKIVDYDIFGFKIGQSMKTCLDEIKKSKIKYSYSEDKKAILLESLLVENPLMKSMRLNFENMILESIIVFPIESVEIETINEILKEKYSFERYKPIFEHETLMLGEMSVSKTGQQYYYTIKKFDIEVELLKSSSAVNQYFFRKDIFYIWFKKKDKSVESGF